MAATFIETKDVWRCPEPRSEHVKIRSEGCRKFPGEEKDFVVWAKSIRAALDAEGLAHHMFMKDSVEPLGLTDAE